MKSQLCSLSKLAVLVGLMILVLHVTVSAQEASPRTEGNDIHIYPTFTTARTLPAAAGVLTYQGGPVMQSGVSTYAIFWVPAKLQNGGATGMTAHYQAVLKNVLGDYSGHGLDNNNTQYYQIVGTVTSYIQNKGGFAGSYIDTTAYPASGCSDSATPGNCITDAQVQAEITKVMGIKGWTGGLNKMFFLFTSSGEGSCFDSTSTSCAYTQYCAYHGFYGAGPTIYGNMPFGNLSACQAPGTPSPNGDALADAVASTTTHELTEAITDPELDAWYDTTNGEEIGDLCAYNYGTNTWDSAKANEMWNGRFYELQQEYDNHKSACAQLGP